MEHSTGVVVQGCQEPCCLLEYAITNLNNLQASDKLLLDLSLEHNHDHGVKRISSSRLARFQTDFIGSVNQDRCNLTSRE